MQLFERVLKIAKELGGSQAALGEALGIYQSKFRGYFKEKSDKNLWPLLPSILKLYPQVNRDWLYFGDGEMIGRQEGTPKIPPIPLTGLAECGVGGWFGRSRQLTHISPSFFGPEWVAVQAVGDSLIPAGIYEGQILFCDPGQLPAPGEVVFVRRADNAATLKIFLETTPDRWTRLQGWMDPDKDGKQTAYEDKLAPGQVAIIAPVIYVRRRL